MRTRLVRRSDGYDYDIGRPTHFGNPYSHKPSQIESTIRVVTREEALRKYIEWLEENPEMIDLMKKFLKGKRIACHCDVEYGKVSCHGQIIIALLDGVDPRSVKLEDTP